MAGGSAEAKAAARKRRREKKRRRAKLSTKPQDFQVNKCLIPNAVSVTLLFGGTVMCFSLNL